MNTTTTAFTGDNGTKTDTISYIEMRGEKMPLIILAGPTAVGKTALSIELAKRVNGAIVSADSMQVYKGMDIGSAKITREEMQGIPHYLIDVLEPDEEFHVVRFQEMVKAAFEEIYSQGKIPILTGGTGFYIQAVLYDIDFTSEKEDGAYRRQLEALADKEGPQVLHQMLEAVDPVSADKIHYNNKKRVIRALEFYNKTGERISEHNEKEAQKPSPYAFCYFVLNDERERIYENIEKRVDLMLEQGLIEEVQSLKEKGYKKDMVSMQGLGYKEILAFLDGEMSLSEAVYILKRDTRHFAKRQLTWFRREPDVIWIHKKDFSYDNDKILTFMIKKIDTMIRRHSDE